MLRLTQPWFHDVLRLFFPAKVVTGGVYMDDIAADAAPLQLIFQNDGDTPREFVADLLRNVFGKPERDAIALTVDRTG